MNALVLPSYTRSVFLLTAVLLAGCGRSGESPDAAAEDVEVVELDPSVVIGDQLEAPPEYLFGDVRTVAVDEAGRIYVGDRIGARVLMYGSGGDLIAILAEEGEGPGEIGGWPADVTPGPGGALYVRDGSRVTVLGPRTPGAAPDSLYELWTYPGYGNLTTTPSALGGDGVYYYPNGSYREGEPPRFFYQVYRDGELTSDTLRVPPHPGMNGTRRAHYRIGPGGGRLIDGFSRAPFAPVPSWHVRQRGTILSSDGRSDRVLETDLAGDTIRVIRLQGLTARSVPPDERGDSLHALEARIDSLPVPLDEVVGLGEGIAERVLPEVLPLVLGLHEVVDGVLWVERWPPEGRADVRRYDVFGPDGSFRRRVLLQAPLVADPPPYVQGDFVVGVVRDPETDVEHVVRFDVPDAPGMSD